MKMKLGVVQLKHNVLFDFLDLRDGQRFTMEEAKRLQQEMLEQAYAGCQQVLEQGCHVIVTPEAVNYCGKPEWMSGSETAMYGVETDLFLHGMAELAQRYGSYIFTGLVLNRKRPGTDRDLTNSCVVINPAGQIQDIYDKIQLAGDEKLMFRAGEKVLAVDTEFGKIGVCICWDMQFPEIPRLLALAGARLILCPTWGWESLYGPSRAYENGIFVASAMAVPAWGEIDGFRTPSQIIAPWGEVLAAGAGNSSGCITADICLSDTEEYYTLRMDDRRPELYAELSGQRKTMEDTDGKK